MQSFDFYIHQWAACSPSIGCISNGAQLAAPGSEDGWKPDTSFLPKLFARRLSRLSKMALFASYHPLVTAQGVKHIPSVFCSRYGEFEHTYSILEAIFQQEVVSPMDFSHSVYNTAQGLVSLLNKDKSPSITVSGQEDSLENAFVKACLILHSGAPEVLVVYHEDALHPTYGHLISDEIRPLAFGVLLSKQQKGGLHCRVGFTENPAKEACEMTYHNHHAHKVLGILMAGKGKVTLHTQRLSWCWDVDAA